MPENSRTDSQLTPAQLTASLAGLVHGPYSDADTVGVVGLAAETIRYFNYAVPRGGITEPATVATVAVGLATAAYRIPLADDHRRPPADLAALIRAAFSDAGDHAGSLAR